MFFSTVWVRIQRFAMMQLNRYVSDSLRVSLHKLTDLPVGDSSRQADPAHQEDVLQQSDEDGDRLVRLHLGGGAQHPHVRVRVTADR